MRIATAVCALMVLVTWPVAAMAAAEAGGADTPPAATTDIDRAAQLDALFAKLKVAPDVEQGRAIESDIVDLWLESGDAEVDRLMGYAIAAMNLNSYTLALNYLDTIVATKPDYAEGWNKRATVYYLMDRFDESVADIEKTLALEPRHFGALAGLGMIMERIGDKERAIEVFKAALDIDPNLEDIRVEMFLLQDQLHKGI